MAAERPAIGIDHLTTVPANFPSPQGDRERDPGERNENGTDDGSDE